MDDQRIHPSSVIHPEARIHESVQVGPFCTIGAGVVLGENSKLISHVALAGNLKTGSGNTYHPFSSIGGDPQDLKFKGEDVYVEIGDNNTFRECVTVNSGTEGGGGVTKIGNGNLFMAYSHAAHDDIIGNFNVIANSTQLAGHVTIGNYVVLGGACAIQQFVRVGDYAYIGGSTSLLKDFPPFCTGYGNRGRVTGVNVIGLKRKGISREEISKVQEAQRIFFKQRLQHDQAMGKLEELSECSENVKMFLDFIKQSKVGITPGRGFGDEV